jgi:hypothetical protein
MPRGVGGSGEPVSQNTAIPNVYVKDITTTSAVVYWANAPNAKRTGFEVTLKNLTTGVTSAPVTVLGTDMDYTFSALDSTTQYEVHVVNLYGSYSSTSASVIFNTTTPI